MECINDLEQTLNFKSTDPNKARENKQIFLNALNVLKDEYKTDCSTKFLSSFVVDGDDKAKSNRVTYLLRSVGLLKRVSVGMNNATYNITTQPKALKDLLTGADLGDNIKIFKNVVDKDGNEKISCKLISTTSHDLNGCKHKCKVGISVYKSPKVTHYNNIPL